ncbi:PfkB domain protein [Pyrolobus fumarii 1A]|uniref:PfkB domain protein n=1 Tax=Pyrolobus fumarii (strain DSM 11204 / 1A) TaxID=694429 RepID=G0EHC9_PYRF1|nr:PfkB domain protein [Pyrolobus fumarii 1A]
MFPGFEELLEAMRETASYGGGNILVRGVIRPGGNAGNTARVLAALGRRVVLGLVGSEQLASIARVMMPGVEVVRLGGWGECFSSIVEVEARERLVNLMFSDKGCLSAIGRDERIVERLEALIRERGFSAAAAVNIAAWGEPGSLSRLLNGLEILVLDTSDVRGRDPRRLLEALASYRASRLTILSMNENEAAYFSLHLGAGSPAETVERLAEFLGYTVCLHTPRFALCQPGDIRVDNMFYVDNPATSTGAGDAWNAGLLDALTRGLDLESAVLHAHRVASCYVAKGAPCTRSQLPG